MSISQIAGKIKGLRGKGLEMLNRKDIYGSIILVLTALISHYLGRIANIEASRPPLVIRMTDVATAGEARESTSDSTLQAAKAGKYVASKSGSKYHLETCPGARSISDSNKIWFSSKEEAEKAGYAPAANCPGI